MRSRLVFLPVSYLVPDCHLRRMAHLVLWCYTNATSRLGSMAPGGISISLFCVLLALLVLLWLVRLHAFWHSFDLLVLGGSSAPSAEMRIFKNFEQGGSGLGVRSSRGSFIRGLLPHLAHSKDRNDTCIKCAGS
jgi:hypothetical protein